jgi:hypothetical protein
MLKIFCEWPILIEKQVTDTPFNKVIIIKQKAVSLDVHPKGMADV